MQVKPVYHDVVSEIIDFFAERIRWITDNGIDRNRLIIDPGIGFMARRGHTICLF